MTEPRYAIQLSDALTALAKATANRPITSLVYQGSYDDKSWVDINSTNVDDTFPFNRLVERTYKRVTDNTIDEWCKLLNSCPFLELDLEPLTDQQVWEINRIFRRDYGLKLVKHFSGIRLVGVDPV